MMTDQCKRYRTAQDKFPVREPWGNPIPLTVGSSPATKRLAIRNTRSQIPLATDIDVTNDDVADDARWQSSTNSGADNDARWKFATNNDADNNTSWEAVINNNDFVWPPTHKSSSDHRANSNNDPNLLPISENYSDNVVSRHSDVIKDSEPERTIKYRANNKNSNDGNSQTKTNDENNFVTFKCYKPVITKRVLLTPGTKQRLTSNAVANCDIITKIKLAESVHRQQSTVHPDGNEGLVDMDNKVDETGILSNSDNIDDVLRDVDVATLTTRKNKFFKNRNHERDDDSDVSSKSSQSSRGKNNLRGASKHSDVRNVKGSTRGSRGAMVGAVGVNRKPRATKKSDADDLKHRIGDVDIFDSEIPLKTIPHATLSASDNDSSFSNINNNNNHISILYPPDNNQHIRVSNHISDMYPSDNNQHIRVSNHISDMNPTNDSQDMSFHSPGTLFIRYLSVFIILRKMCCVDFPIAMSHIYRHMHVCL